MRVLKFGGTSVGNAEAFAQVVKIVGRARAEDPQTVVVTSAMSGVTNALIAAATAAARGATELTLADLAAEFDQRLSKQLPGKENPFRAGAGERWRASGGLPADGEGATIMAEILVTGAADAEQARAIARRIA